MIPYTEQGEAGEEFLIRFCKCWTDFTKFAKLIEKLFDFLNRYYLKNQSQPSLGEQSLQDFKEIYFDQRIKSQVIASVIA